MAHVIYPVYRVNYTISKGGRKKEALVVTDDKKSISSILEKVIKETDGIGEGEFNIDENSIVKTDYVFSKLGVLVK